VPDFEPVQFVASNISLGGGIGGLALTIGLLHQHISCTVYEAAAKFAEIGAGVSFGPNAIRAMYLLDPSIEEGYKNIQTRNAWDSKNSLWFDFRLGMEPETWEKSFGKRVGDDGQWIAAPEAHFLDVLVKLVPDGIAKFGKRVEEVVELPSGKMELTFHDGSKAEADAVIGCDGVKSRTRQLLLGVDHPSTNAAFTGKYAYRGLIPMEKAIEALGEEFAVNSQMYLGHHGHVLTFPIEKGKTMNVVAFRTMDGEWKDERWVLPMKREDMMKDYEGWGSHVSKILPVGSIISHKQRKC
jgi:salicylate hydroxylase